MTSSTASLNRTRERASRSPRGPAANPLQRSVEPSRRPQIEVMRVMAEFYLLEMMRAEEPGKLQDASFRMRPAVAKWCDDVNLTALQDGLLNQEAPRVFQLMQHLIAEELRHVQVD